MKNKIGQGLEIYYSYKYTNNNESLTIYYAY